MALYYVSAGTTTPAATHATIAAVNADAGITSGDTVYFNRGETFNDATLATDAGVTYDAYGSGALPIIDGLNGTRGCVTNTTANTTVNNLELKGGLRCLEIQGTNANFTSNNLVLRGSTVDGATTECLYESSTGANHVHNNMTIYQPHNAAVSKGIRSLNGNGTVFNTLNLIGVTGLTAYNAIECITPSVAIQFNDCTIDGWNGVNSSSRIVYLRGAIVTSTKFIMNDCTGAMYISLSTVDSNVTFDQLDVSNLTGVLQSVGGTTLEIKSGTWVTANTSFLGALITLSDINTTGKVIKIVNSTAKSVLTRIDSTSSDTNGFTLGAVDSELHQCTATSSAVRGFDVPQGTTQLFECSATLSGGDGIYAQTGGVIVDYLGNYSNNNTDGVSGNGTGSVKCIGTKAHSNGSVTASSGDGFTAHDSCRLDMYGCSAAKNYKSGVRVVGTAAGTMENCTFYDNFESTISPADNFGISIDASGGWAIKNCITEGHLIEIDISAAAVTGGVTIDYGCYNNTRAANAFVWNGVAYNWADYLTNSTQDTNSQNADPLFADKESFDFTLQAGSPCIDTGSKPSIQNSVGSDSEPFSDYDTSIGGVQSQLGKFHPVNL